MQKKVLAQFEEKGLRKKKMEDGVQIDYAVTKYWVKYDGEDAAEETTRLNITRMFAKLLKSKKCPDEIKLELAKELNNTAAKEYLKTVQAPMPSPAAASQEAELQTKRKALKTDGKARAREDERQELMTKFVALDPPVPQSQFDLCLYYLAVFMLMCHLPFTFIENFYVRRFFEALRPNFAKMLSNNWVSRKIRGVMLDEIYEEAVEIAEEALAAEPGLITVGIDGHKDGRGRSLETVTKAKLGVSTFAGCEYMLTERATGQRLAATIKKHILATWWLYIAVVADNTGNNTSMFAELSTVATLAHFFFLGCYIHVLDLLIEDLAKLDAFATLGKDAHFVISFIKSHSIIYEDFLEAKTKLGIRTDLHLYPATRFAYLYFMLLSLFKCIAAVRVVIDSPVYKLCKEQARKRGGEEGRKALAKFNTFEAIVETRSFKPKLEIGANVLMPLSCALHYLEGDSVPISHMYPVFQGIFDFVQSLADELSITELLDSSDCEKMMELVKERWLGATRKVGLKADVHLLAFVLDPYAQAAMTTPDEPTTTLLKVSAIGEC